MGAVVMRSHCENCLWWSEMIACKPSGETEVKALCLSAISPFRQTYMSKTMWCRHWTEAGPQGAIDNPKRPQR